MRALHLPTVALVTLGLAACSSDGYDRAAGRPTEIAMHGWIDFTVADASIPADPIATLAGRPAQPPSCELTIDLDGRVVLTEPLQPSGTSPPYAVASTFRFSVPPGEYGATIYYSGCRTAAGQSDIVTAEIRIPVRRSQVTRVRFDGSRLHAEFPARASPE